MSWLLLLPRHRARTGGTRPPDGGTDGGVALGLLVNIKRIPVLAGCRNKKRTRCPVGISIRVRGRVAGSPDCPAHVLLAMFED